MNFIYAECEIINSTDLTLFRRSYLEQSEIKKMNVKMRVNLTIKHLCINERIQQQLQLEVVETKTFRMEDNSLVDFPVSSPVELHFKNRRTTCQAIILPAHSEPVLGQLPFLDMDVAVHISNHTLIANPAHPGMAWVRL